MRKYIIVLMCAFAAAGAHLTVYAAEIDIAEQSAIVGEFGTDDTSVQDSAMELIEEVTGVIEELETEDNEEDIVYDTQNDRIDAAYDERVAVSGGDSGTVVYYNVVSSDEVTAVSDVAPAAEYDTYYGSISTTYVEYMRGYVAKLTPSQHYVGARVSQYEYIFAYGEDLSYFGGTFSGSVTVVKWNTSGSSASLTISADSAFSLNAGSNLVYSDLSKDYPALSDSGDMSIRILLYVQVISFLVTFMMEMYQVRRIRRIGG